MKIDWFTVIAQLLNFVILVWLLKRFLYKPILNAIDAREKKINAQLADAENKKLEAKLERNEFIRKNETFDAEKQQLIQNVIAETKTERERLLKEARIDADTLKTKHAEALSEMQNNLMEEYKQHMEQEVFSISKKTLIDLASVDLESKIAETFIKQLEKLNESEKNNFVQSFKSDSKPMIVQSAFILSDELQHKIKKAVDKILGIETNFQFKVEPDLIAGLEITANGYKLAWSVSEYIDSLKKTIAVKTDEKRKTDTKKEKDANK